MNSLQKIGLILIALGIALPLLTGLTGMTIINDGGGTTTPGYTTTYIPSGTVTTTIIMYTSGPYTSTTTIVNTGTTSTSISWVPYTSTTTVTTTTPPNLPQLNLSGFLNLFTIMGVVVYIAGYAKEVRR